MLICDDCRKPYPGPPYYTVECGEGNWHDPPYEEGVHPICTGSMCPDCAGPYLTPDVEGDPRRPIE